MKKSMTWYLIKAFIKKCVILLMLILLVLTVLRLLGVLEARADYVGQEVQTQVNKRTDLFDKSINNFPEVEKQLLDQNQANINAMGDGRTTPPQSLSFITKKSKSELEHESAELSAIHENDLNTRGRNEVIKNNTIHELYPNYSSPLNKQHMADAQLIAAGQNKLLDNLFAVLKEQVGIDCKTVKGDKKHEPEYFLQIKTTLHKDTVYTQVFCEELRNQYSCSDSLNLTCKRKGIKWGPWQDKQIHVPAQELFNLGKHIFWIHHTAPRCFEYKLIVGKKRWVFGESAPNPYVVHSIREFLVTKHPGSTIDNISDEMNSSWYGGIFSIDGWTYCGRVLGYKDHAWNTYVINYRYREGSSICLEWSEDWTERCVLK